MYTTILIVCALIPQIRAGVFITAPVQDSTGQGGQSMTISWKDDGTAPTLAQIGPCEFGIYAGNQQQQTELQPVAPSVDVSKQSTLAFKVDPTIGPNSKDYFIRVTSLGLKETANPQVPYEAFSSKFTLSGMTGQFSPAVQSQINGITSASAAPTGASGPGPALTPPSGLTTQVTVATASASHPTAVTASASAAKTTQSSAALMARSNMGSFGAAVAIVAALLGLSI